jgi:hypothetical protein
MNYVGQVLEDGLVPLVMLINVGTLGVYLSSPLLSAHLK